MNIEKVLKKMNLPDNAEITPFINAEDGEAYQVWQINTDGKRYVLKKAKGYESQLYKTVLSDLERAVPRLVAMTDCEGETFILTEFVDGDDLRLADREKIRDTIDALIYLQDKFWDFPSDAGLSFETSLGSRISRGEYLCDSKIEEFYLEYLSLYKQLPRTLCHDDLLPFNVIAGENGAYLIDWEYGGILPYPTSIARLIAHCEENENAFFYMRDEDKIFALDYYYDNLIKKKGISRQEYDRAVDLFLLYEYCEWIMLGNKYPTADMTRYKAYLEKVYKHIENM